MVPWLTNLCLREENNLVICTIGKLETWYTPLQHRLKCIFNSQYLIVSLFFSVPSACNCAHSTSAVPRAWRWTNCKYSSKYIALGVYWDGDSGLCLPAISLSDVALDPNTVNKVSSSLYTAGMLIIVTFKPGMRQHSLLSGSIFLPFQSAGIILFLFYILLCIIG